MRQLVYTMFISNNRASIHFWWKEKFSKTTYIYFSKYCTIDCRQLLLLSYRQPTTNLPANRMLQSAPIPTKIDFYLIFLNIMWWIFLKVLPLRKNFEKRVLAFFLYISKKIQKLFMCSFSTFIHFKKNVKVFSWLLSIFFKNSSLFINSNVF